jgi:hypothetical protein
MPASGAVKDGSVHGLSACGGGGVYGAGELRWVRWDGRVVDGHPQQPGGEVAALVSGEGGPTQPWPGRQNDSRVIPSASALPRQGGFSAQAVVCGGWSPYPSGRLARSATASRIS